MIEKAILIGGGDYRKNENTEVDDYITKELDKNAKILIIPFAVKEKERRASRINSIRKMFNERGFSNVEKIDDNEEDKESMKNKIKDSFLIFITGGDPKLLLSTLDNNDLLDSLASFNGVIVGYSAGAMIFRKPTIVIGGIEDDYESTISIDLGLGAYNFVVSPHYSEDQDEIILKESQKYNILAIADKSAVILKEGIKKIIGEAFLFEKGNKKKVTFS